MISLTKFAAIARQYGVGFSVEFTVGGSFVVIAGSVREWQMPEHGSFYAALCAGWPNGPVAVPEHELWDSEQHDMWFPLESLT